MERFQHILYVAEQTVDQTEAIARAVSVARSHQARLDVVDFVTSEAAGLRMPPGGPVTKDLLAWLVKDRTTALEKLVAPHRDEVPLQIEILTGEKRFLEIVRAVQRKPYDLVVKAGENPDWIDRLLGSDDMHLMRKCPCPVWLTKPEQSHEHRRIVAAVDLDPEGGKQQDTVLSRAILDVATSVALADAAELHIVHAWDTPDASLLGLWASDSDTSAEELVEQQRARHEEGLRLLARPFRETLSSRDAGPLESALHLPRGNPHREIPRLVNELGADLVVMGTVARTGIPGLFIGNTAEAILDQLNCAMIALKPPGFVSPVPLR